jgi:DNA ligase D-like protein (predicted 3'-phosphoesterase)
MGLSDYRRNWRYGRSPAQPRRRRRGESGPQFVIQHYAARSDHYEFRLEIDGVIVTWAIPRGPSVNPQDRRMARRTEDHPIDDAEFGDVITEGEDSTGTVVVWDQGTYANRTEHDMTTCLGRGHLSFRLNGDKLHGGYALTRVREGDDETWLLVKRRDDGAAPAGSS